MRIVVLDGYTANPGDLAWDPLAQLGELTVHDRSAATVAVAHAAGATAVLTNKVALGEAELAALPDLRYIGVLATGVNVVDLAAARARGITVTNVPGYSTPSVAQFTFALLGELCCRVGEHTRRNREGAWSEARDFCWTAGPLVELAGLTIGLVGVGAIAQDVARIARAYGMRVIACRRGEGAVEGMELVDQGTVFSQADVVSLHCPLTTENAGFVDAALLATMKRGAFLINTARGALLDEQAIAAALRSGQLAGVGVDVLSAEPPPADNPLLHAPNCVVSPHVAWATRASRARLLEVAIANFAAWQRGAPRNVVG